MSPNFLLMRKQQPTPVDTGTQSTEADAVVVSTSETSKPKGKRGWGNL